MRLPKPTESHDFEPCPAGNHLAVCYQLVDFGTQETNFEGKTSTRHEILIGWEIPEERMEDGRPFMINQRYRFSMHEKAKLRHHLEAWRGRAFTDAEFETFALENILNTSCMLQVIHTHKGDKTYANIASVAALPKGMKKSDGAENELVFFSFDEPNGDTFDALPEWMRETIAKSPQFEAWMNPQELNQDTPEMRAEDHQNQDVGYTSDIPF